MPYEAPSQRRMQSRAVACRDCRHKKLKCDLEYPQCGRCTRSKTISQCVYDHGTPSRPLRSKIASRRGNRALDTSHAHSGSSEPQVMISKVRTLKEGQHVIKWKPSSLQLAQESDPDMSESPARRDSFQSPEQQPGMKTIMKGNVIRYRGNGIVANLLLQLPDVKSLMGELRASSGILNRMGNDFGSIKRNVHKSRLETPGAIPGVATLLALLPPREAVDELVKYYLQYIELTHRILHIPSFRRELEDFWSKRELAPAAFIVQLLLILACAEVLYEADQLQQDKQASTLPRRFPVIDWIHYSERWIETSGQKWPDLTMLRVHCLLIVAKNSQCLNQNRAWLVTGNLVRLAMLAGYHRDPKNIKNIDPFTGEMRRRIWITILELDLQAALDQGFRPCLEPSSFDTALPLNVNDIELYENMPELPLSKPLEDITDSSFQVILAKSLSLRLAICAEMHSPTISCTCEEVLRYELNLERITVEFPDLQWHDSEDEMQAMRYDLWTSILETKLSQTLLALHTPFVTGAAESQRFGQSSRTQLEASMAILSRQCRLHKLSMMLSFCHMAYSTFQAALSVLHYLYTNHTASKSPLLSRGPPIFAHSISLVEEALECLESKLLPVLKGVKQYFLLMIILIVVKVKIWPDQAETIKKAAIEHLGSTVYNIIAYNANFRQSSHVAVAQGHTTPMESSISRESYFDLSGDGFFANSSNPSDAMTEANSFWGDLLDWNESLSLPFPT